MNEQQLNQLVSKLSASDNENENLIASCIENNFEQFLDDDYETNAEVLESTKEICENSSNGEWMFDDEDNEERNSAI